MRGAAAPTGTFTESRPDRPTSAPLSLKLGEGRLRCSDAAQTRGAESTRLQQPTMVRQVSPQSFTAARSQRVMRVAVAVAVG